ncbi:MAG: hypothetical protein ACRCWB_11575 [Enterovibrio sp.]
MFTLEQLADRFITLERGDALILERDHVLAQATAAASFHAGFSPLEYSPAGSFVSPETVITLGEWAQMRSLFMLYVERETALQLEATRQLGADVFGRTVSEVASEIATVEADYARRVFVRDVETV